MPGPRPASVAAVVPVFASARAAQVARATLRHVDELVLVDDGAPPEIARSLAPLVADERVRVLTLGGNGGKGTAVAAGVKLLLDGDRPPGGGRRPRLRRPARSRADPGVSSRRLAPRTSSSAGAAIGARCRSTGALGNRLASVALLAASRAWVPDTQNGMRLFRTEVLRAVPPPGRRLRGREPPPARPARRSQSGGGGRDPDHLRRRAQPLPAVRRHACRSPGVAGAAATRRRGRRGPTRSGRRCCASGHRGWR